MTRICQICGMEVEVGICSNCNGGVEEKFVLPEKDQTINAMLQLFHKVAESNNGMVEEFQINILEMALAENDPLVLQEMSSEKLMGFLYQYRG